MDKKPIVAWLVCTAGENKGRSYGILPKSNLIGSSESMSIVIKDVYVKEENHAAIIFDERCRKCYVTPGNGKRVVRLNGMILFSSLYVKAFDKIEIGENEFVYVPYSCSPDMEKPSLYVKKKSSPPCTDILSNTTSFKENPVVGWLVVTEGVEKDCDYVLTAENNYIGSSEDSEVHVKNDATMLERQAVVTYDCKDNAFFIAPLNGSTIFIGGQPVTGAMQIKGYEEIYIGSTRFLFVPFCGDHFRWEESKTGE